MDFLSDIEQIDALKDVNFSDRLNLKTKA